MSQRTDRLDSQIQQELMLLLQREMKDPRLGFATVTRVETSRDLGHARVWVSVYGEEAEREATMAALHDATPWLRRQLAQRLSIRVMPQLTMKRDDSIESGDRVLRLLRELEEERRSGAIPEESE
ncbi:MAG TPA: 30S ribosome-binding factor RbfA [Candidatus Limnocylindria bacterium]|nr:30S ribosome-binding factor RbfA [Candidatus Limnocylindria bacterium]